MKPRQIALGAGLAATVAATVWLALSPEEEAVVAGGDRPDLDGCGLGHGAFLYSESAARP